MIDLILASASPRRRELVQLLGLDVSVMVADVDESSVTVPDPAENVVGTALLKAEAVRGIVRGMGKDAVILGSDTTVADGLDMLNKPRSVAEARQMLKRLRGRTHYVHTGIALCHTNGKTVTDVASVAVPMRDYSNAEIEAYIETGDPMDKAGAYAIQHKGFAPVLAMSDCFAGVMGLPLCHLTRALREFDIVVGGNISAVCQTHLAYTCSVFSSILD